MFLCMLSTIIIIEFKYFNVQIFLYIIIIIVVVELSAVIIHYETHMI